MSTQTQKATSGRRELARSRMRTLSVLGGAGSVALAGMAAGAAAQAYAVPLASPRAAALGEAASAPTPIIGALTESQMLAVDFALPPPRPNTRPAAEVAQTSGTRQSAPAAIGAPSAPGRGARAATPQLALTAVPAPRPAARPAAPMPVKTGQS